MGIVYEATDPLIGRKVALKVIRLQELTDAGEAQLLRDRLFREARLAGVLSHPGIVVVVDVGQEGDLAFVAMERVEGVSLYQALASGRRIPRAEALEILRQAAAALDYAHWNGVVHRDIKPANIMMDKGVKVKIADFGIAKVTSTDRYTQTGVVMGTPSYMSPEQIEALPSDGRSDQFSLAVVAYELLTGSRPFQADYLATLAHKIVYGDRPSARAANPGLPPAVDVVLHRSLARLPHDRYPSCTEFVAALEEASQDVWRPQPNAEATGWTQIPAQTDAPRRKARTATWVRNLLKAELAVLAVLAGIFLYRALSPGQQRAVTQVAEKPAIPADAQLAPRPKSKAKAATANPLKDRNPEQSVSDPTKQVPAPAGPDSTEPGNVERVGNGVSAPSVLAKVDPEYSEAGRRLHAQGTILLDIVIQPDGTARDFRVLKSLGYGLDEKAVEAVRKWRFKPGMKDGNAVPVRAHVEVNMRLVKGRLNTWYSGPMAFAPESGLVPPVAETGTMPNPDTDISDESVVLEFAVGSNGSVKNIHAIYGSASASGLLAASLSTWTFRPALKGNRSVEVLGRVRFVKGQGDEAAKLPLVPPPSQSNPSEPDTAARPVGVNLTPLDPAMVDDRSRSLNHTTAVMIDFVNQSGRAVDIYWIDYQGNRRIFAKSIAAGATFAQGTFLTHPWLVVASGTGGTKAHDTGNRLAGFEAVTPNDGRDPAKRYTAIITDPNATNALTRVTSSK